MDSLRRIVASKRALAGALIASFAAVLAEPTFAEGRRGADATDPNGSPPGAAVSEAARESARERKARRRIERDADRATRGGGGAGTVSGNVSGKERALPVPGSAAARGSAASPVPAPPAPGSEPGGAPGPVPPAPTGGVDVDAEMARVEEMQAYSEQHFRELAQESERFKARMQAATTREERSAIQEELKRYQTEKNAEFQRRMAELRGPR